jgi:cytochrome c peroxidase
LITIVMVMAVSACQTDPQFQLYKKVTFKNNERFGTPVYNPAEKGLSPAAFELGRRLFYDPRLSINDQISCGSCHQAVAAFAHADHDFSHGVNNKLGLRNSPVLFNLAWHDAFFWDGGVNHIESQPINPIEDTLEMGIKLPDLLVKLNKIDDYDELMKEVYGSDTFTSARLFKSLALFMTMMVSDESKWDAVDAGKESFTNSEAQGAMLFQKHCTHCHTPPLFTNLGYHSNGLPYG